METVDVDLTELTAAIANLSSAADTWGRLEHPDVVQSLKGLTTTLVKETELLFEEEGEVIEAKKPSGGRSTAAGRHRR